MAFSGSVFKFATFVTKTGWNYHKNGKIRLNNVLSSIYQKEAKKKITSLLLKKKKKAKLLLFHQLNMWYQLIWYFFFSFLFFFWRINLYGT